MADKDLDRLVEAMAPPEDPRFTKVNWAALEEAVGLPYPQSFKEYIVKYGASIWFDNWIPVYTQAKSVEDINDYVRTIADYTSGMKGHMSLWGKFNDNIDLPLYPQKGGLLPFMVDYSGGVYSWKTANANPDKWPVICWIDHQVTELRGITIAGMLLEFINRVERMRKVWGDINDLEPLRRRVDRG